jgi:hypothetical protein
MSASFDVSLVPLSIIGAGGMHDFLCACLYEMITEHGTRRTLSSIDEQKYESINGIWSMVKIPVLECAHGG